MASTNYEFDVVPAYRLHVNATLDDIRKSPGLYYNAADIVWMMASSALVLLMVPATGLLYSGTSNRSTIYMTWMPIITTAVVGIVWFLWGYAIAFSPSGSGFWGGPAGTAFHDVLIRPVGNKQGPQIPELVYVLFQGMFACFTASLVSGATIYKERTLKWIIFVVFWVTLVYCPIAHWSWNPEGWGSKWGTLDFAGGTPVHICAGTSALAYSLFYLMQLHRYNGQRADGGPRRSVDDWMQGDTNQHVSTVLTGTILLWIGWFGFNGGSALGANMRAVAACISTHLAACAGGITGCLLEAFYSWLQYGCTIPDNRRREVLEQLVVQFCNGAVVGLVAVTPGAGYISPYYAPIFGLIGAFLSFYALKLSKYLFDTLDIFAIHAVGGFVGMILTAFFARADIVALDGYSTIPGGANTIDDNWNQL
ncbi:ammonium transporter AmtB-like domain-containing protein [Clohesyomyces aquaticus]|uniref:Ammonium transporter AmtB-like domain-containing protein n=1 Tax=Clohesyomyces aquaticus TaxID=1231657 RepID=A0A1Y1Y7W3_9PLEO|nr:ammonium transporter AmtB-like domain-containing protein [Clohesyomyces aquaticus]